MLIVPVAAPGEEQVTIVTTTAWCDNYAQYMLRLWCCPVGKTEE